MSAKGLLAVLRSAPGAAIEAIRKLRIAGPWLEVEDEDVPGGSTWARRREFDGTREDGLPFDYEDDEPLAEVLPDEDEPELGKWFGMVAGETLDDPEDPGERLLFDSAEEARAAVDERLSAWVLR
jgi:hypothetical protein